VFFFSTLYHMLTLIFFMILSHPYTEVTSASFDIDQHVKAMTEPEHVVSRVPKTVLSPRAAGWRNRRAEMSKELEHTNPKSYA